MSCNVIWEFAIEDANREAFERAYAPGGPWARLFAESEGFLETRLLRAKERPGVYQTIDRWASREAYAAFKRTFAQKYEALDEKVGDLSHRETYIGLFDEVEV
ncbi:antibiotic biosynthesis monooxygenase family protein [Qipengyuania sp.]|uniref:antibiotic biosynthesis monooxygenase family protein n=1 Tax=Qipengyuania sp. TaxID=2004515 RepID=UPI0035C7A298